MKILVISDVHGTAYWKEYIKNIDNYEYVVSLGDWFDNHECIEDSDEIENFKEALEWKNKYKEKFIMLLGNHDLNSHIIREKMSGNTQHREREIFDLLIKNRNLFSICFEYKNYVFSHAGISKTWMKNNSFSSIDEINKNYQEGNFEPFRFRAEDENGESSIQGPMWIRPKALISDYYYKKQIVGHTMLELTPLGKDKPYPFIYRDENDKEVEIIFTDSVFKNKFFELEV